MRRCCCGRRLHGLVVVILAVCCCCCCRCYWLGYRCCRCRRRHRHRSGNMASNSKAHIEIRTQYQPQAKSLALLISQSETNRTQQNNFAGATKSKPNSKKAACNKETEDMTSHDKMSCVGSYRSSRKSADLFAVGMLEQLACL